MNKFWNWSISFHPYLWFLLWTVLAFLWLQYVFLSIVFDSKAVIFVTQVRATNLQELVYKNGQAGVTKATVSITFDNSNKQHSPMGIRSLWRDHRHSTGAPNFFVFSLLSFVLSLCLSQFGFQKFCRLTNLAISKNRPFAEVWCVLDACLSFITM